MVFDQKEKGTTLSCWFPIILLITFQVFFSVMEASEFAGMMLVDADGYTRLARIEALMEGGSWFDKSAIRTNTPYGATLHWTRPFDLVVIFGAVPFLSFLTLREALYWSGALVSPFLHIVLMVVMMWAFSPLLRRRNLAYLGVLLLALPAVHSYFSFGRADHHSLILLMSVTLMGFSIRSLLNEQGLRWPILSGLMAGGLLWVSVEAMVAIGITWLGFFISWIVRGQPSAKQNSIFSLSLFLVLAVGFFIERPRVEYSNLEYDTLSLVHIVVFSLPVASCVILVGLESSTRYLSQVRTRGLTLALLFSASLVLVGFSIPEFFYGPYTGIDPRVITSWQDTIQEMQPMLSSNAPLRSLREFLFLVGHSLIAIPVLIKCFHRQRECLSAWWLITIASVTFMMLAFYQVRWAAYAELILAVPCALLLGNILDRVQWLYGHNYTLVATLRSFIVVGISCVFLLLSLLIYMLEEKSQQSSSSCPVTAMASLLGKNESPISGSHNIMMYVFDGPEVTYRSSHAVVGSPYERNTIGILDTHDFFSAVDNRVAYQIVESRSIDFVLICNASKEAKHYTGSSHSPSLHDQLRDGKPPSWLLPIPLPKSLDHSYSMFKVLR